MLGGLVAESQRAQGGGCGGVVEARDGTLFCSEPPSVPVDGGGMDVGMGRKDRTEIEAGRYTLPLSLSRLRDHLARKGEEFLFQQTVR
jgi:hypothetical protein